MQFFFSLLFMSESKSDGSLELALTFIVVTQYVEAKKRETILGCRTN